MQIDVTGLTADGDNRTTIQAAIDAVHNAGGGRVIVPAGTWPSGSIQLRDHVDLHLSHAARILARDDASAYDAIPASIVGRC